MMKARQWGLFCAPFLLQTIEGNYRIDHFCNERSVCKPWGYAHGLLRRKTGSALPGMCIHAIKMIDEVAEAE